MRHYCPKTGAGTAGALISDPPLRRYKMDKRPETHTDQQTLLDLQERVAAKSRPMDLICVILTLALIFGLSIAMIIIPDKDFSEQENRYLQKMPELTLKTLVDGSFTGKLGDYFSDQFPMRDVFVGIKGAAEISLGKRENDSVTLASDGYIVKRGGWIDYDIVDRNLAGITALADKTEELGIPYIVAVAGRGEDVLVSRLPALYPDDQQNALYGHIEASLGEKPGITYVGLRDIFRSMDISGVDGMYYRTDHHWTSRGALTGANAILSSLGRPTHDYGEYTAETVSEEFYGTTWSSGGMKWVKPDTMEFLRFDGDDRFYTYLADYDSGFSGFYDRSYLEKKDKYSAFVGGNTARTDVYLTDENGNRVSREKLIVIKDSFAHSAAPYLAREYDLIMLDLRYYKESVAKLAEEEGVSGVLVLVNADSLVSAATFAILRLGL